MYSLYYAPGAASLLVHWLLIELGVPHELRLVDTKAGQQKSPEYLALNPNGVVPTLIDENGQPRFECYALPVPDAIRGYMQRVQALPGVKAWIDGALQEKDFVVMDEPYRLSRD